MRTIATFILCAAALTATDQAGRRAPGFALPDSTMKIHDLADYRGRIVLLEFMQTDCVHCVNFAKILSDVQRRYAGKVQILTVVNASHDNSAKVEKFAAAHDALYPILYDQGQMEYSYVRKAQVENPYVFLVDETGYIRADYEYSAFTRDVFEGKALFAEIDKMLGANKSVAPATPSKSAAPPKTPTPAKK
jgi:peroxiredoxin